MRTVITVLVSCAIVLVIFIALIIVHIVLCKRNRRGCVVIPCIFMFLPIIVALCLPLMSLYYAPDSDTLPNYVNEPQYESTIPEFETSEEYISYDGENWDFNIKDINFFLKAFNSENLKFLETDNRTLVFITLVIVIWEIIFLSGPAFFITILILIIYRIKNIKNNNYYQKNVYLHNKNKYSDNDYKYNDGSNRYNDDSDRYYDNDRYNI